MKVFTLLSKVILLITTLGIINSHAPELDSMYTSDGTEAGGAYLTFAEKFGGEVSQAELRSTVALGVSGCAAGSKITTYRLEVYTKSGTRVFKNNSYKIDKEITNYLTTLKKGDSFNFFNVRAKLPKGNNIDVVSRKFIVV